MCVVKPDGWTRSSPPNAASMRAFSSSLRPQRITTWVRGSAASDSATAPSMSPTPQPPPETTTTGAPSHGGVGRFGEAGRGEPAHPADLACRGEAVHLRDRLLVGDQVHVHAGR